MLEPEPNEALSVRKLVVETAKFNVTTAYSAAEAKELLQKLPRGDDCGYVRLRGGGNGGKVRKSRNAGDLVVR